MTASRLLVLAAILAMPFSATGCGVGQAVKDGTVNAARWAFTTPTPTMAIDIVNRSGADAAGSARPTIVRVYQLKTAATFQTLDDATLLAHDRDALNADLLSMNDAVMPPGGSTSLTAPMHDDAQCIGVVAFVPDADHEKSIKLLIPRKQWTKTVPVKVEVVNQALRLLTDQPAT